ncbi:MAG: 2-(1,2-epoxy-1,2-dihydrophenyl)acetyl-CoA isomerase PaaG [Burkholderiales bacterium]|nr:2-(1,2-epoxy-1,2-dihydrophenyl)acetyl-CoA isomerase PaaG [Burkholderiales bacterium]
MPFEAIRFDVTDQIATITLHRPERLNSFTEAMHVELRAAMDEVEKPGVARALIITGSGRGFSAGQDLADSAFSLQGADFDVGATLEKNYNPLLARLRALPMPVIAAVNGVAAGAAANLALACDLVFAGRSAYFLQAFAKIGLIPDAGGTYSLPHRVGMARALGLALLAEPLPAEKAAEWGLIWKCVDDDKLMDEVTTLARKLAQGPTRAYALIKQSLYAAADNDFTTQVALEAELQRAAGATADFREGVGAFLEKRAPHFTGR